VQEGVAAVECWFGFRSVSSVLEVLWVGLYSVSVLFVGFLPLMVLVSLEMHLSFGEIDVVFVVAFAFLNLLESNDEFWIIFDDCSSFRIHSDLFDCMSGGLRTGFTWLSSTFRVILVSMATVLDDELASLTGLLRIPD
jgi:hypothetical protein